MIAETARMQVSFARQRLSPVTSRRRHVFCGSSFAMNVWIVFTAWMFIFASSAAAQTNERLYEDLDFRFVTPGARAIAMGKTFVGLADDATAAYSNPAGLSNLLEQEISFELNTNQIKHHRFVPSETGETQVFGERVYTPSFFSYAVPVSNFTLSAFRNVVQDYEEQFEFSGRFIPAIGRRENGAFGDMNISAVNYGAGGSYLLSRFLSIGGSIIVSHLDIDTHGGTGNPDNPRNHTDTVGSDAATSFILGVLIKPTPVISMGVVYNRKSIFHLETTLHGQYLLRQGDIIRFHNRVVPIDYVIPDRIAFGGSWKVRQNITISADIAGIRYSQQITGNFLVLDFINQLGPKNYRIRDVTEVHAGGEYRFYTRKIAWALRAGMFTDPSHPLVFQRLADTADFPALVEGFRFNDNRSSSGFGGAFGAGIAINNRIQFDTAFSFNRNSEEIVASWVWKI